MPTSHHRKGWTAARSKPDVSSPKRTKRRQTLRQRAALMHAMLGEIGRNPVYTAGVERGSPADRSWSKQAKAWLEINMKRYVTA